MTAEICIVCGEPGNHSVEQSIACEQVLLERLRRARDERRPSAVLEK